MLAPFQQRYLTRAIVLYWVVRLDLESLVVLWSLAMAFVKELTGAVVEEELRMSARISVFLRKMSAAESLSMVKAMIDVEVSERMMKCRCSGNSNVLCKELER